MRIKSAKYKGANGIVEEWNNLTEEERCLMIQCPVCKGKKKLSLSVSENGVKLAPVEIKCVHCEGLGVMSVETFEQHDACVNAWCKCGPHDDMEFHDDAPGSKHHWTCRRCGKLVQVG
jgi:hypothetical protein